MPILLFEIAMSGLGSRATVAATPKGGPNPMVEPTLILRTMDEWP